MQGQLIPRALGQDQTPAGPVNICAAIELSNSRWVVAIQVPTSEKVSVHKIAGGDVRSLLQLLDRTRRQLIAAGFDQVEVHTCHEVGYDGFWLHRLLEHEGIHNYVLDSASIYVSRRGRHLKTDRLDAEALVRVLLALLRGERRVCSVVQVPTPREEDEKRLHRSRAALVRDRTRHLARIKAVLALQGVRHVNPASKDWMSLLRNLQTRDGRSFPPMAMAEIKREAKLLQLVNRMLGELDEQIARRAKKPRLRPRFHEKHLLPKATQLQLLKGLGPTMSTVFATELFYKTFDNRRQLASYAGLTPTPYNSGSRERDQGISKAGNPIVRHHAVELAWLWLMHQPDSAITQWFHERVGDAKGRVRRIAIVAVARKLIVALWRFLETGLVPEGARLRPLSR
jgi:transposase